ncbi:cystatin-2-like isoform X2 [Amblyomma americanum]
MERNNAHGTFRMSAFLLLVLLLWDTRPCWAQFGGGPQIGGWQEEDIKNPFYALLAHWAEDRSAEPGRTQYTLTAMISAAAQLVEGGMNYRITYVRTPTNCNYGEDPSSGNCRFVPRKGTEDCIVVIFTTRNYAQKRLILRKCMPQGSVA